MTGIGGSTPAPRDPRRRLAIVAMVCALAIAARMAVLILIPDLVHPDEILQYSEQAFRAVEGHGLVPWEYRAGIRSWIIPGLLIPWMALARLVGAGPEAIRLGVGALAGALSLVTVAGSYAIGERAAKGGGLWAACLNAFWPESLYYGPHVLADTVAVAPMIGALAVVGDGRDRCRLMLAGCLFSLATLLRPQLAPAIAIAFVWIGRLDWRRYAPMVLGAMPTILLFGLVDLATWGVPFRSIFRYVRLNQAGIAATFGVLPADAYLRWELAGWSAAALLVLGGALLGARRAPLLAAMAVALVVTFSAIGHKEGRFVYPVIPLLLTLAGIGTAMVVERWRRRDGAPRGTLRLAAVLAAAWVVGGAISAAQPITRARLADGMGAEHALQAVNTDPLVCGLAVLPDDRWGMTGHVRVRRDIGLYRSATTGGSSARSYNALIVFESDSGVGRDVPGGFARVECFRGGGQVCLYRRATPCTPGADRPMVADPGPAVTRILRRERLVP